MLKKLKAYKITILVSTPYMDEAMRCDRVALIQNGRIMSVDTPGNIRKGFSRKLFSIRSENKYKLLNAIRRYPEILSAYPFGDSVHITLKSDRVENSLVEFLGKQGFENASIEESTAGIEDRFLELMENDTKG
jgi:ABC-type multidrug transport system ATPase subunit